MGDVRTRTRQTRVRLPDVAVIREETMDLEEKAMSVPPLIAIEILWPEYRMKRVIPRLESSSPWALPMSGSSTRPIVSHIL